MEPDGATAKIIAYVDLWVTLSYQQPTYFAGFEFGNVDWVWIAGRKFVNADSFVPVMSLVTINLTHLPIKNTSLLESMSQWC